MKENSILRGDIFYADLDPVIGSEQGGNRPVLVLQNNRGNRHSSTTIVAAITSSENKVKSELPTHVSIPDGYGLENNSVVLLEQLRTIDKERLTKYICTLDQGTMKDINYALVISTGIGTGTNAPLILCLCPTCANQFYDSPDYFISRLAPEQIEKDTCTYCHMRQGFDYKIFKKTDSIKR